MDIGTPGKSNDDLSTANTGFFVRFPAKKWVLGGAALALLLGAFWRFSGAEVQHKRDLPTAPVRVVSVSRQDMAVIEHTIGTVIAPTTVQVTARVQGVLEAAYFKEGQFVKRGDLLFQIDPRGFVAALAQARAVLLRDEAQLRNANRDMQRYVELSANNSTSAQQLDTATTNAQVLAATVEADKAALRMAELNVDYAQIRSSVDGKTGPLLIQPGNMISATGSSPLVTIVQLQPIKVSFTLSQSDLPRIQARQKSHSLMASLDSQDAHGERLAAPVDFTDNAVNNQTGTIELRASFANADFSLVPGELVNVTVQLDNIPDARVVPREALNDGPNGPYVYVAAAGRAVPHLVKVLFDDSQNVAVEGDLNPGDQVITEGQLRVIPNGPIDILPSISAAPAKNADAGAAAPHPAGKRAEPPRTSP